MFFPFLLSDRLDPSITPFSFPQPPPRSPFHLPGFFGYCSQCVPEVSLQYVFISSRNLFSLFISSLTPSSFNEWFNIHEFVRLLVFCWLLLFKFYWIIACLSYFSMTMMRHTCRRKNSYGTYSFRGVESTAIMVGQPGRRQAGTHPETQLHSRKTHWEWLLKP